MAVACTVMDVHDRRLSISKTSASKISKPSTLKNLSVASSPSSSSTSPPSQLPSSITSSPSRPIAKVVNADPSSFRRVVQELTGTTVPSTSSPSSQPSRGMSRLQRIAPPPLRSGVRTLHDSQHQTLLEQFQQQQASHMLMIQQQLPTVGALSSISSGNQFGNCNPNPISDPAAQLGNPSADCTASLPMLSPHLLSPLPVLTPGDNTWANPIDVMSHSPKPVISTASVLSSLSPLPDFITGNCNNGQGNVLMAKPVNATSVYGDTMLTKPAPAPPVSGVLPSLSGQAVSPLFPAPSSPWFMPSTSSINVLPPWSPSPIPFSPGLFPPSPGPGPPAMAVVAQASNTNLNSNIKYGCVNPNLPNNFTF